MSKSPLYSSLIISSPSRRRSTQYQYLLRLNTYMFSIFSFFLYLSYTLRWINASMWVPLKKIYERTVQYKHIGFSNGILFWWTRENKAMFFFFLAEKKWNCCWKNFIYELLFIIRRLWSKKLGKKEKYCMGNWIFGKFKLSFPIHYGYWLCIQGKRL